MIIPYKYELWDGKKVVGEVLSSIVLQGNHVIFSEFSILKMPYNRKTKDIKVPLITRIVKSDGVNIHLRVCLCVKRKSKRQIQIILNRKMIGLFY